MTGDAMGTACDERISAQHASMREERWHGCAFVSSCGHSKARSGWCGPMAAGGGCDVGDRQRSLWRRFGNRRTRRCGARLLGTRMQVEGVPRRMERVVDGRSTLCEEVQDGGWGVVAGTDRSGRDLPMICGRKPLCTHDLTVVSVRWSPRLHYGWTRLLALAIHLHRWLWLRLATLLRPRTPKDASAVTPDALGVARLARASSGLVHALGIVLAAATSSSSTGPRSAAPEWLSGGLGSSAVGGALVAARAVPFVGPAMEAFALVFFSEFGDKSMFTTALLAMRYGTRRVQRYVMLGSMAALTTMTLVSCFLGHLMRFLPARVTLLLSVALLTLFGIRFLQQAYVMWREHRRAVQQNPSGSSHPQHGEEEATQDLERHQFSMDDTAPMIFAKSFSIIALAEWCDRSMFATMALAASTNAYAVILGATAANLICTSMAVAGGSLFRKLPERVVNFVAGVLFLATAAYTWLVEVPETE